MTTQLVIMSDPILRHAVAMLIVGAIFLVVGVAVDHWFETKRRRRISKWKRDGSDK